MAPDETVSKPYKLLYQALIASQYSAIAKVTMHGREHSVLIRTAQNGLLAHTLFYPNELRAANKPNVKLEQKASGKELELAKSLIEHLAGPFKPQQLHDAYRENVERLIEQKKKGQKITSMPHPRKAPVIDLMEALKRSLSASGKPPKSKVSTSKTPRKRRVA
jgi:DNA end-binding protein Ku